MSRPVFANIGIGDRRRQQLWTGQVGQLMAITISALSAWAGEGVGRQLWPSELVVGTPSARYDGIIGALLGGELREEIRAGRKEWPR
jgi:hypothetical protein